MLKHFAALTLAMTVIIAVMAEGEMGNLEFDAAKARAESQKLAEAEANKIGVRKKAIGGLTIAPRAASFGPDEGGGGGGDGGGYASSQLPEDLAVAGPGRPLAALGNGTANDPGLPKVLPPGMSQADFMNPGFDRKGRKRVGAPRKLTPAQMARIMAGARAPSDVPDDADTAGPSLPDA